MVHIGNPGSAMAYVIKRYSNRKLYDTQESRYVILEELEELIRAGKIHTDALTVTSKSIGENYRDSRILDENVIRPFEKPLILQLIQSLIAGIPVPDVVGNAIAVRVLPPNSPDTTPVSVPCATETPDRVAGITLAAIVAPLSNERREKSVPGTRAVVSSQQLMATLLRDARRYPRAMASLAALFKNWTSLVMTTKGILSRCRGHRQGPHVG